MSLDYIGSCVANERCQNLELAPDIDCGAFGRIQRCLYALNLSVLQPGLTPCEANPNINETGS
ncbi:MAG: hypothetical protein ACREX3_13760 [Gammaproteobacteria bacterium]